LNLDGAIPDTRFCPWACEENEPLAPERLDATIAEYAIGALHSIHEYYASQQQYKVYELLDDGSKINRSEKTIYPFEVRLSNELVIALAEAMFSMAKHYYLVFLGYYLAMNTKL